MFFEHEKLTMAILFELGTLAVQIFDFSKEVGDLAFADHRVITEL